MPHVFCLFIIDIMLIYLTGDTKRVGLHGERFPTGYVTGYRN
jgi:hypothetical protein